MERLVYRIKLPMLLFWLTIFIGEAAITWGLATMVGEGSPEVFWGTLEIAVGVAMIFDAIVIAIVVAG